MPWKCVEVLRDLTGASHITYQVSPNSKDDAFGETRLNLMVKEHIQQCKRILKGDN